MINGFFHDVGFALRRLRKSPGFAVVAVLTLALGIGTSSVLFSVVYNGVIHPFPYRSAERLTTIEVLDATDPRRGHGWFHLDEVAAFRQGNHTFEDVLAYGLYRSMVFSQPTGPEMVKAVGETPNAMDFWGVPPLIGRGFGEQDVQSGSPLVVLLNYRFWMRKFDGDKSVVGTSMMLNGKSRTVIGVMPPRFQAVGADMYMPISWTRPEPVRGRFEWDVDDPWGFWATGILKQGVSFETADADIDVSAQQLAKVHPDDYPKKFRFNMKWLNDIVLSNFKQTLLLLFAAVGLLLFICCSNVAGLLLAHASARTKEISLRAALGATRRRLVRQLLSESLVLAAAGCTLGCLMAYAGLKGLMLTQLTRLLPNEAILSMNRPMLAFAIGISFLCTLMCGLAPALHAVRGELQSGLASTGVNVNASFQHSRFRSGLVIGQVALSIILLTCAGLVARRFIALVNADIGVRPKQVFTARVHFPKGRYTKGDEKRDFFDRLLPQLETLPGVNSATELIGLPSLTFTPRSNVTIPGKPHQEQWMSNVELCSDDYFRTLGLHLLRGRLLTESDMLSARKVAVVNEKLARKFFEGEDPIGRLIKFNVLDEIPETPHDAYFEIVGIVRDARNYDFEGDQPVLLSAEMAMPQGFLPYSISGFGDRSIAMLTRVPPVSLVNNVRKLLWNYDHDLVLAAPDVDGATGFSLNDIMEGLVYGRPKFAVIAFSACAALGFALALVGLFSLMSFIVSLKTHDIGVRLALGAPRTAILSLMVRRGFVLIASGIVFGLLTSLGVTHFLASQFPGISAADPLTLALVILIVMLAGLSACFLPARRATQVDPMATLRNE
jgi:putative ABC transport system permease protein